MNNFEEAIVGHVEKLPPMPKNIIKLRELFNDENSSLSDAVKIVKNDPSMVANILHLVNSAIFGINHSVDTLEEAIRYIGFEPLINFLATEFSNNVAKSSFQTIPNIDEFFNHSKMVSLAAKLLAKVAGKPKRQQSLVETAGLLHDIGRLIILVVCEKNGVDLLSNNWTKDEESIQEESELLGMDHCNVGQKISHKWQYSIELENIIQRHHNPFEKEYCENAAYIQFGHFLTMDEVDEELLLNLYPEDKLEQMGLSKQKLSRAKQEFEELKELV